MLNGRGDGGCENFIVSLQCDNKFVFFGIICVVFL